jgi:hypothetical protein
MRLASTVSRIQPRLLRLPPRGSLVDQLVRVARDRGFQRVSLETGSRPAFAPARSLYAGAGFTPCGPFGDYGPSRNSTFMRLSLTSGGEPSGGTANRSARPVLVQSGDVDS